MTKETTKLPSISTVIVSYNHQDFIVNALESALMQKGDFLHEIIVSDDGSTDGTAEIIKYYCQKNPKIRDLSSLNNIGISQNYRRCFNAASGDFISILEGDDYWTSDLKNHQQMVMFNGNPEMLMVFSALEIFYEDKNEFTPAESQIGLPENITGNNLVESVELNPIINLSCAMFRSRTLKSLPDYMFHPRLSELTLGFYIDRIGEIGFVDCLMSVYRKHAGSVWTGASEESKLVQAIQIREAALNVARPEYRNKINQNLQRKKQQLLDLSS